ncbi:M13 family metallopeptidase [Methanoculleus chikugoensis]|uniref:M13 family metallopeptidase n=1 Tax=Methanoculleus chikugoensis TaxID=118126 RepID=UPI001FB222C3|nr:M13 family metallopeptidase [Methanoculleus chikugoensis]
MGRAYVDRYVDPRTRDMVSGGMVAAIRETFDERIADLAWMSEPTKPRPTRNLLPWGGRRSRIPTNGRTTPG